MSNQLKLDTLKKATYKKTQGSESYYLGLFTVESWREFKRNGAGLMGFNENKAKVAATLKPGDRLICYLTKVSAFIGVIEVTSTSYIDNSPIWSDGIFPVRLPVKIIVDVPLTSAVPIRSLSKRLSFGKGLESGTGWTIHVRTSPRLWPTKDALEVLNSLEKKSQSAAIIVNDEIRIIGKEFKQLHFENNTRVAKLIQKSQTLFATQSVELAGSYDKLISFNKVTGYSVNVPIYSTCKPTATCIKTCYFSIGAPSWSNSLRHQAMVFESIKANPITFAERIALEYDQLGLNFLRWNGGGDLFSESVAVINYLGKIRPDIILWVVTRIPEYAAQINHLNNVFIHFSLDKHSLGRKEQFLRLNPRSQNYFFSYQCEPNELPNPEKIGRSSVLFFDNYQPTGNFDHFESEVICPLNGKEDISGTCIKCRRCFDGTAVMYEKNNIFNVL